MSGLHFCNTINWYSRTKKARSNILYNYFNINDEQMLYNIVKESNILIDNSINTNEKFILERPVHGVHMSLNRQPFKQNSKIKNIIPDQYIDDFYKIYYSADFQAILKNFKIISNYFNKFCCFIKTK